MFMSVTLARCPASSDIMMVVTRVLLGGDLLPALPVTTMLCLPPATVLPIFLSTTGDESGRLGTTAAWSWP